jgi:hypothetical protein
MKINFPGLILLTLVVGIPQRATSQTLNACVTNLTFSDRNWSECG